jgi:hypothetical protein
MVLHRPVELARLIGHLYRIMVNSSWHPQLSDVGVGESGEGHYFGFNPLVRNGLGICRRSLFSNQDEVGR